MSMGGTDKAGAGIQQAGQQQYERAAQTPQEAAQYSGSFDLGKLIQQIYGSQLGLNAAPAGLQSAQQQYTGSNSINQALYNQTLQDVQNPYGSYESALQPALQQAQDTINKYYQSRGLLNSGLAIGQMGQAGVDLAIQEAQGKMQARQQALQNAQSVGSSVMGLNQNNLANLSNLYSNQQQFGLNSLNRQAQAASTAAQYQAYPYQAQLGNIYGMQQGSLQAAGQMGSAALMAMALR